MAKNATINRNIARLKRMAKEYGCEDNALFSTALEQYIVQQRVIDVIRTELDEEGLSVSKEYVKGRENVYAHPLVKELPKHSDSANRTADLLLRIINTCGTKKEDEGDGFEGFVNERDSE